MKHLSNSNRIVIMKLVLITVFFLTPSFIFQESWNLAKEKNNIKVYTRISPGLNIKEFKAISTFKTTKDKIKAELKDVTKMNEWYDMVEKVEILKTISPNEVVFKLYFDFPAMVDNRYSTIKATLHEGENGDFNIVTKFENINHEALDDYVFVKNIRSEWRISGKDNAVSVEHIAYMDPSGNIPQWLVNSSITDGPIKTLTNLRARIK